jgi:hypothetical protein
VRRFRQEMCRGGECEEATVRHLNAWPRVAV